MQRRLCDINAEECDRVGQTIGNTKR